MIKILFICHGNICRSPLAEFVFKDMVKKAGRENEFYIESAATSTEEIGNDVYPPTKKCMTAHNVPFEPRAARQITKKDLEDFDYIFAMEKFNIKNLESQLGPNPKFQLLLGDKDIDDPWYTGEFERTYNEIVDGCTQLLNKLC